MIVGSINTGFYMMDPQVPATNSLKTISEVNAKLGREPNSTRLQLDPSQEQVLEANHVNEGRNLISGNFVDNYA